MDIIDIFGVKAFQCLYFFFGGARAGGVIKQKTDTHA